MLQELDMLNSEDEKNSCCINIGTISSVAGVREVLNLAMVSCKVVSVQVLVTRFVIFVVEAKGRQAWQA